MGLCHQVHGVGCHRETYAEYDVTFKIREIVRSRLVATVICAVVQSLPFDNYTEETIIVQPQIFRKTQPGVTNEAVVR